MFSFKSKNTKMVMCFLAFLFFGFILFNLLGNNMEGFDRKYNPGGKLTHCISDGWLGDMAAFGDDGKLLICDDQNTTPRKAQINGCFNRNQYRCTQDTNKKGVNTGFPQTAGSRVAHAYNWRKI